MACQILDGVWDVRSREGEGDKGMFPAHAKYTVHVGVWGCASPVKDDHLTSVYHREHTVVCFVGRASGCRARGQDPPGARRAQIYGGRMGGKGALQAGVSLQMGAQIWSPSADLRTKTRASDTLNPQFIGLLLGRSTTDTVRMSKGVKLRHFVDRRSALAHIHSHPCFRFIDR